MLAPSSAPESMAPSSWARWMPWQGARRCRFWRRARRQREWRRAFNTYWVRAFPLFFSLSRPRTAEPRRAATAAALVTPRRAPARAPRPRRPPSPRPAPRRCPRLAAAAAPRPAPLRLRPGPLAGSCARAVPSPRLGLTPPCRPPPPASAAAAVPPAPIEPDSPRGSPGILRPPHATAVVGRATADPATCSGRSCHRRSGSSA